MGIRESLTEEELKIFDMHYTECDFDDECDVCDTPKNGSFATGYDSCTGEVDGYVCGKCAIKSLQPIIEKYKHEYEELIKINGVT